MFGIVLEGKTPSYNQINTVVVILVPKNVFAPDTSVLQIRRGKRDNFSYSIKISCDT